VTVIFFREPWGQTAWTRLEETAIKDGCLKHGWSKLLFVQLDKTSKLPVWLPHTHVRFAFEDYGTDQLVGATKARVPEHGAVVEKPDAVHTAARVKREAEFLADKARLFRDRVWIEQNVHASLRSTMQRVVEIVEEGGGETMQPPARAGAGDCHCVLTDGRVGLGAGWKQEYYNVVDQDAHVFIREFRGGLILPGERRMYMFQPELLNERKFVAELTAGRELVWKEEGRNEVIPSEELAHQIAITFFKLVSGANKGEIE
jgi:hypothetical protein